VLWLVRVGFGLTDARYFRMTQASSRATKIVIPTMIQNTSELKEEIASLIGPPEG
jgi:hypothetical protein